MRLNRAAVTSTFSGVPVDAGSRTAQKYIGIAEPLGQAGGQAVADRRHGRDLGRRWVDQGRHGRVRVRRRRGDMRLIRVDGGNCKEHNEQF